MDNLLQLDNVYLILQKRSLTWGKDEEDWRFNIEDLFIVDSSCSDFVIVISSLSSSIITTVLTLRAVIIHQAHADCALHVNAVLRFTKIPESFNTEWTCRSVLADPVCSFILDASKAGDHIVIIIYHNIYLYIFTN